MKSKTLYCLMTAALAASVSLPALADTPPPYDNPGVTANPAQGEVATLQRISLTYANERGVVPNPYQYAVTVTRYGDTESLMGATAVTDSKQYNVMHITLDRTIREPGTYVITVPTGFAQNWEYEDVAETKWLYTVTGGGGGDVTFEPYENSGVAISPRQGVYNKIGEDFQLNFDYKSIGVNPAMLIRMVDDATGAVCGTFSIDYTFTDDRLAVLNQFVLRSDREVTAPGSYTLEFPDGTFYRSSDSEDIGAFNFRYVVSEDGAAFTPDPAYSFVYPSPDQSVRSLDRLTVTFPDYEKAAPSMNGNIKITDAAGNTVATGLAISSKEGIGQNQVAVTFQPVITAEGEYTVTMDAGTFSIGESGVASKEIQLRYTVKENAFDPDDPEGPFDNRGVKIYPEQGRYKSLNTFTLTFDCEKTGINFAKMVTVYNDETGEIFGTCGVDYGANFGKEVTADVLPWMNVPGTYTIVFPQGTFYDFGSEDEPEMPVYKFRYVIDPDGAVVTPVVENVTADPKSGSTVNSIETIRVTFPDYERVERSYIVDQLNMEIKVVDASGQTVSEGSVVQDHTDMITNTMQINFDPVVKEKGDYDVIFARRVFILGEEGEKRFNEEFKLHYNILQSSIDSITGADTVPAAVYTLQGVKVENAAAPGIYIVVGADGCARKIVVR